MLSQLQAFALALCSLAGVPGFLWSAAAVLIVRRCNLDSMFSEL